MMRTRAMCNKGVAAVLMVVLLTSVSFGQSVVYVDVDTPAPPKLQDGTSWATAYAHPQHALAVAVPGNEIWIAEGTYMPDGGSIDGMGVFTAGSGDINATFLITDGIDLYGSFTGTESSLEQRPILGEADNPFPLTRLSGNLANNSETSSNGVGFEDNSVNVMRVLPGELGSASLDGLEILSGNGDGVPIPERGGGGIRHLGTGFTLNLCNMRIANNRGRSDGGGMTATGPYTIRDSSFFSNVSWGGSQNATGGALHSVEASFIIANCTFRNNDTTRNTFAFGGAINIRTRSTTYHHIQSCKFISNNSAEFGGAIYINDDFTNRAQIHFANCLFVGNGKSTNYGGAIYNAQGWPRVRSCTFAGNGPSSFGTGGAIYGNNHSNTQLWNCLFTQNRSKVIAGSPPATSSILRVQKTLRDVPVSSFIGGFEVVQVDNSLFFADLGFVDPLGPDGTQGTADDNYRLAEGSPAIDFSVDSDYANVTGDPATGWGEDYLDLDRDGLTMEALPADVDQQVREVELSGINDDGNSIDMGCYEVQICQDCPGERRWRNLLGGQFNTALNWFPGVAGVGNTAVFDLDAMYDIAFTSDVETFELRVNQGDVLFDLNGFDYTIGSVLTSPAIIAENSGNDAIVTVVEGRVDSETLEIGRESGSSGSLTLSGADALWVVQDDVTVGVQGDGALTIEGGASLFALETTIGSLPGSFGQVSVTGAGSVLDVPFIVGVENGSLDVSNGGTVFAGVGFFGGVVIFDNGSLTGDGTVDGSVVNFGDIFPGGIGPSGRTTDLTITGDYLQQGEFPETGASTGTLCFGIESVGKTPAFDRLTILGDADLAGGLVIESASQIDAADLPALDVLNASSVTGRFDVAFLPGVTPDKSGNGRFLRVEYPVDVRGDEDSSRGTVSVNLVVDTLTGDINTDDAESFDVNGAPAAAAVGDLNNDGLIDLALAVPDETNPTTAPGDAIVLFNAGSVANVWQGFMGSVQIPVGINPSAIDIGRADQNAGLDLAVANQGDDTAMILTNDGLGGFAVTQTIPVGDAPSSIVFGELDEDKWDSLAVANFEDDSLTILANDGMGMPTSFSTDQVIPVGDGPIDIFFGELDEDKWDDIAVALQNAGTIAYLDNTFPPGTFDPPVILAADAGVLDLRAADLDGDLINELFTANPLAGTVSIILNNGDSTFEPVVNLPLDGAPRSIAAVDLDDDGDRDLAVIADDGNGAITIRVLRNDLTLDPETNDPLLVFSEDDPIDAGAAPLFVLAGDVDSDGQGDLVTVNSSSGTRSASSTRGPTEPMAVSVVRQSAALCPGDCDNDGSVNFSDLVAMLGEFGTSGSNPGCDADGSGAVDFSDLVTALGVFGVCE